MSELLIEQYKSLGISEEVLEQFKLIARKIGNNIEEILKE